MSQVRVQIGSWNNPRANEPFPAILDPIDTGQMRGADGSNWQCRECGDMRFTVEEVAPGMLCLSCFSCPAHYGVTLQ